MKFYFLGLILGVALMTGCSAAPAENRSYKENNAECIYKLSSAARVYLITYKDEEYLVATNNFKGISIIEVQ